MDFAGFFVLALHEIQSLQPPVAKPSGSHSIDPYFASNKRRRERDVSNSQNHPKFDEFTPLCYNKYSKEILFETLDSSLASLKIPWLQASERLAPCSQNEKNAVLRPSDKRFRRPLRVFWTPHFARKPSKCSKTNEKKYF